MVFYNFVGCISRERLIRIKFMHRRSKNKDYSQRAKARSRDKNYTPGRHHDNDTRYGSAEQSDPGWIRHKESLLAKLPSPLPKHPDKRHISVYVEGYEDVSFWRGIFDDYELDELTFEISVPPREDLAKGKKVLLGMAEDCSPEKLLCVDSDFDYLFGDKTEQAKIVNGCPYMFHTYTYATENYLCYAPSLHNVCVKATKNDTRIFDFESFMHKYSKIIYPLFLWYAYSAQLKTENVFTLLEFKSSVKLNYLEVENNGEGTLTWLARQVEKRLAILRRNHPSWQQEVGWFSKALLEKGVTPETTYMYMQGHTLMDNVVVVMLNAVCEQLKLMSNIRITTSTKTGTALKNELSNYNNALRNVRDILLDNESYKQCPQYLLLRKDIDKYIASLI